MFIHFLWAIFYPISKNLSQIGIQIIKDEKHLILNDKCFSNQRLNYISSNGFKQNDVFVVSFNFKNNILIIYHNGIEADILSLEVPLGNGTVFRKYNPWHRKITPAFSLSEYKCEQIKIIKYYSSY